jgi:PX domain
MHRFSSPKLTKTITTSFALASAHIQKYSITPEGHVEYFIKVVYIGKEWPLRKRYSDFSKFDSIVRSQKSDMPVELPPKRRLKFNSIDPEFLAKRLQLLQGYLDSFFCYPLSPEHSLVKEFLEVDFRIYPAQQTR